MHEGDYARAASYLNARVPSLVQLAEDTASRLLSGFQAPQFTPSGLRLLDSKLGVIELSPLESGIIATPLMQRLRTLHRLPLMDSIYPSVVNSRFQFSIATVGWMHKLTSSLTAIRKENESATIPTALDVEACRLAGLLREIASIPFSEIRWQLENEFKRNAIQRAALALGLIFETSAEISAELVVVALILLSNAFRVLLGAIAPNRSDLEHLLLATTSLLVGSVKYLRAKYLIQFVRGPLAASQFALLDEVTAVSLPHGSQIDSARILSLFRIVDGRSLKYPLPDRGDGHTEFIAVDERALAAVDSLYLAHHMAWGRTFYHPRNLLSRRIAQRIAFAISDPSTAVPQTILKLTDWSESSFLLDLANGKFENPTVQRVVRSNAARLLNRSSAARALSFATVRFGVGRAALTNSKLPQEAFAGLIARSIGDIWKQEALAAQISHEAVRLRRRRARLKALVGPDVYLTFVRFGAGELGDIPIRLRDGEVKSARALLSASYGLSHRIDGHIWCDEGWLPDVTAAARQILAGEFDLTVVSAPFRAATAAAQKTAEPEPTPEPRPFARKGPISANEISADELRLKAKWLRDDSAFRERFAAQLKAVRPDGFQPSIKRTVVKLLDALSSFQEIAYLGGLLRTIDIGRENELHCLVRDQLRGVPCEIGEGLKLAGGSVDLLFENEIVIEIKILRSSTDCPMEVGEKFALQARRYALALDKDIVATVIGYKAKTELGIANGRSLMGVRPMTDTRFMELRFCVPVAYGVPSRAR